MLPTLRRSQILAAARQRGGVSVRELSRRLNVSAPTIRRDLSALAERGLVARVHGGALPVESPMSEHDDAPRPHGTAHRPATAREIPGMLVVPGMAVGISAGPTAVRLARLLRAVTGVTVVTPAPAVADALRGNGIVVVIVGGVRTPGGSHAGSVAVETLRRLNLDIAFVEVRGATTTGYLTDDPLALETNQALLGCAARRVLLATSGVDPGTPVVAFTVADPADILVL